MDEATTLNDPESIRKRETARTKLVQTNPDLVRVQDALEHSIVIGAKVRRDGWRRQEFERLEALRSVPSERALPLSCPPLQATTTATNDNGLRGKRKRPSETMVVHAEDLRIYGKRYNRHLPPFFPKSPDNKRSQHDGRRSDTDNDDSEWNLEHGDSIPPILFRMARLSQEYPSEEELSRFQDPQNTCSKSFTSTNVTVAPKDVPRALIEKCWERAVHIASNRLFAPVVPAMPMILEPATWNGASSNSSSQQPSTTPIHQESCREKCESLGVDLESLQQKLKRSTETSAPSATTAVAAAAATTAKSDSTTCPRCTRSFSTTQELLDHFYGTSETKLGCCRALIRPRHLDLIRKLLQTYVESQTDQLASLILSQAAADPTETEAPPPKKPKGNHSPQKGRRLQDLEWRDVRRYVENAVRDSTCIPPPTQDGSSSNQQSQDHPARHPVQESIHIVSGTTTLSNKDKEIKDEDSKSSPPSTALPLMLNPMILEAVHRRLVDRYADVPP